MRPLFTKRNIIGGTLSLVLVGEVSVGMSNGLFTLGGIVVFSLLYITYFNLLDGIVSKFRLSNVQTTLVNFALYSVLITGLLHGEIAEYVTNPENTVIITLIRVQCSLTPLFVYALMRNHAPPAHKISLRHRLVPFMIFITLMSFTETFGFGTLLRTIQAAPTQALGFIIAGTAALWFALRLSQKAPTSFGYGRFTFLSVALCLIGLIPSLQTFLVVLVSSLLIGVYYLALPRFRNDQIC